jgi:hypothetical protein
MPRTDMAEWIERTSGGVRRQSYDATTQHEQPLVGSQRPCRGGIAEVGSGRRVPNGFEKVDAALPGLHGG